MVNIKCPLENNNEKPRYVWDKYKTTVRASNALKNVNINSEQQIRDMTYPQLIELVRHVPNFGFQSLLSILKLKEQVDNELQEAS